MGDEELAETVWHTRQTQLPVPVALGGVVARAPGCAVWVSNVRLYRSAVQFDVSLLANGEIDAAREESIDMVGWQTEEPASVRTSVTADGQLLPRVPMDGYWRANGGPALLAVDGAWHAAGTADGGANADASWWVPLVPVRSLVVHVAWPRVALAGDLTFHTTDWPDRARKVETI